MKKVFSLVAISALVLSIAACTKKAAEEVPPAEAAAVPTTETAPAPAPEQAPAK